MEESLDIDCLLNNLHHQPMFETSKQAIIQGIDSPISAKQIQQKLKKINKTITQSLNICEKKYNIVITKGQCDSFKMMIEVVVSASKESQFIPHVIATLQMDRDLLQILQYFHTNQHIFLEVVNGFDIHITKGSKQMIEQQIFAKINNRTRLICYPYINKQFGVNFLDIQGILYISTIKQKYPQIIQYLDISGGFNFLIETLQNNLKDTFSFDFWSFDGNQIHMNHQTGVLGFNNQHFNNLPQYVKMHMIQDQFYAENIPATINSLNVYICNRTNKNNRLRYLKSFFLQEFNKIQKKYANSNQKQSQIVQLIDLSQLKCNLGFKCIPTIHYFGFVISQKGNNCAKYQQFIQSLLKQYQLDVQIDPMIGNVLPIQISFSDMTFKFVIDQFIQFIQQVLCQIKKVN